jgi:hypothetical protein
MKRTIVFLSSIAIAAVLAFASVSQAQPNQEKLGKQELLSLIATAKTPAEHSRLAAYYNAEAQDYLAQSKEHEQMVEAYKKNPAFNTAKSTPGPINHCLYLAQHLKESAVKMQELAKEHDQMAKVAGQK